MIDGPDGPNESGEGFLAEGTDEFALSAEPLIASLARGGCFDDNCIWPACPNPLSNRFDRYLIWECCDDCDVAGPALVFELI